MSPKLEPSTDPHPPLSRHPPGPPVELTPLVSPLHHTNPFSHSQTSPPPISPCNPFFSLLQHNPFYDHALTARALNPPLPPLPYLSSSRPPVARLFPQAGNPTPVRGDPPAEDAIAGTVAKGKAVERPVPPVPTEGEKPFRGKSPRTLTLDPFSEWDESFQAFAAGRLQSPEDLTTDCKTQPNAPSGRPLERGDDGAATRPRTDPTADAPQRQPRAGFASDIQKAVGQATSPCHPDTFAQFLETIPEHASFESDSPKLDACAETNRANGATHANDLTDTNMHQAPRRSSFVKLNSSSPDPSLSGIGSSEAEEDFVSFLSSYSDKLSASSSEEAGARNFESNILCFEKSCHSSVVQHTKPSEDVTDRSTDVSSADVAQHTVVQRGAGDEEGSLALQPPSLPHQQPAIDTSEDAVTQSPNSSSAHLLPEQPKSKESEESLQPVDEIGEKFLDEFLPDFSTAMNDSPESVSNTTDVTASTTPDDELHSPHPSLHIITSSPDVRRRSSDSPVASTRLGRRDASRRSPRGPFADFLDTSRIANGPDQDSDDALLHARESDRSASSFSQSLYVTADSQDYQTCESRSASECSGGSEPNETLHSASATLRGELNDTRPTAGAAAGREDSADACEKPRGEGVNRTGQSGGPICGAEGKTATLEPIFPMADDFDLLPVALTDSHVSCDLGKRSEGRGDSRRGVFGDAPPTRPEPPSASLHRSQSEGSLTPAFDELLLLPCFGSDPGAIQESFSTGPGPQLPYLTSFAPCLTPQSSSSPVTLCSLPPLANASARSPHSTAREPLLQETTPPPPQAANQQNR